ncbi:MAG TPA: choice-of-anchor B family protein [Gemmatimonadales bacterium]|nr:choice-of-anchor B family protein [Gemmatimonadales bacterium]
MPSLRHRMAITLLLASGAGPAAAQEFGAGAAVAGRDVFIGQASNQYAPGYVYVFRAGPQGAWTVASRIGPPDSARNTGFGRRIAVDGNTMLISESPLDSASAGRVHAYERTRAGAWRHVGRLEPTPSVNGDRIGRGLALKGDVAVIGSSRTEGRGEAWVFRRQGGQWRQEARLRPEDVAAGAAFGNTVAFDGRFLAVGAQQADSNAGAVYLFRRDSSGTWKQDQKLTLPLQPGMGAFAQFGASILFHEGTLYIGAPGLTQGMGAVIRFAWDSVNNRWNPQGGLLPFDATPGTQFGTSVAVLGNELWIGAPGSSQFEGRIFRYTRDSAGAFTNATKIAYDTAGRQYGFGSLVVGTGDLAVVAMGNADFGEGRAAIVSRSGSGLAQHSVRGEVFRPAAVSGREVNCSSGKASIFGCEKVNLLALVPVANMGGKQGTRLNDVWGWTDPESGKEYAIVGRSDGTSFVDVSNPGQPRYLGDLPKTEKSPPAVWRDMKVYRNHVFIVADGSREHGMQVFDLTRLRRVTSPQTFTPDHHYTRINSAHNIVIDTTAGYAYIVGASSGGETCGGGLHMVNIRDPKNPVFAGCFQDKATGRAGTGYSHDAQCTVYHGPDTRFTGRQICIGANENAISIADVTDKEDPKAIGRGTYPDVGYAHQGWFSDDHRYWYQDDELDELEGKTKGTRTIIWDLQKLDDPVVVGQYEAPVNASDHNLYIVGNRMYNSNYVSGLRVVDISDRTKPKEIGHFDTVPVGADAPGFGGSWSNYPFFKSGTILVTSGNEGLFLVKDQTTNLTP